MHESDLESEEHNSISSPVHTILATDSAVQAEIRSLPTFKLVGDNLDKSVQPREMTIRILITIFIHRFAITAHAI